MRKIFLSILAVSFLACNNSTPKTEEAKVASAEFKANTPTDMHGFTPTYSASFVMDSAKNTETVLALWKEWKDGDLSRSRSHFADTLALFFADGTNMVGPTDSLLKGMQEYRSSFKNMGVLIDAVFAVKSTDKDENWVAVWGVEMPTDSKGKTDTISLQETWRFNKEGKADFMFQATRKGMLPPAPAK
jgi:hypothetical protein